MIGLAARGVEGVTVLCLVEFPTAEDDHRVIARRERAPGATTSAAASGAPGRVGAFIDRCGRYRHQQRSFAVHRQRGQEDKSSKRFDTASEVKGPPVWPQGSRHFSLKHWRVGR
jgi:hypothetical protein